MCIEFAKNQGDYDFCSPLINMMGNGLVIAGVGAASALIVGAALKALGYKSATVAIGTTIPLIAGSIGLTVAFVSAATLAAIMGIFIYAMTNRT